jgi:purine-binding chemotaxis protein CheW
MHDTPPERTVLLLRTGATMCALPIACVVETMRPLATRPLAGTPAFVTGAAVVRGEPMPVVDLAALLTGAPAASPARFVLLRCGDRHAALAVDEVLGVERLAQDGDAAAPLLAHAAAGSVSALRALDGALAVVLRGATLVPEDAFRAVRESGSAA